MADLQRAVSIIFTAEDRASAAAAGIADKFDGLGAEAGQAGAKVDDLNEQLERTGGAETAISKATAALTALAASLVVKDFIDANVAFEQFERTMTFATGSAAQAAQELEYVRDVSTRLGVETRATAESYATFSSAVKGTALEGESARTIFEAFTGQLALLGRSSTEISGAFVQLAQGISKGKFELEDLKSIAERVPGFFGEFAKALGVTTADLFDLVSAGQITGDEILIFARKINEGLEGADFDGFNNKLSRLRNSIDDTYKVLGDAGVFDALGSTIEVAGGTVAGFAESLRELTTLAEALFDGDISAGQFVRSMGDLDYAAQLTSEILKGTLNESLAETERLLRQATAAAADNGDQSEAETQRLLRQASASTDAIAAVDASLKALGIDPKKIKDPLLDLIAIFEELAANPAVRGDQLLAGLEATLRKVNDSDDINELGEALSQAFASGKLSAEEYALAAGLVGEAASKIKGPQNEAAKATEKTASEMRKAEQAAKDYQLEMEKLASNERIKLIEAKVTLDVAKVEAQSRQVIGAFESINNTVTSTGDVISSLFSLFTDFNSLDSTARNTLLDQIKDENRRRDAAIDLQQKLVEAQIKQLEAQTRALDKGDPLIQVDGTNLEPHLEAFMWEILKAIQVRVNQDGLQQLLGV